MRRILPASLASLVLSTGVAAAQPYIELVADVNPGSSHPHELTRLGPTLVVLEFELTVTDNDGAVATDRVRITVTR